jgi:hypothetical protein
MFFAEAADDMANLENDAGLLSVDGINQSVSHDRYKNQVEPASVAHEVRKMEKCNVIKLHER